MAEQMALNEKQAYGEAEHNERDLTGDMQASSEDLEKNASYEAAGDPSRVGDDEDHVVTAKTWSVVAVS